MLSAPPLNTLLLTQSSRCQAELASSPVILAKSRSAKRDGYVPVPHPHQASNPLLLARDANLLALLHVLDLSLVSADPAFKELGVTAVW